MSAKVKFILTYVGGIITGCLLMFGYASYMNVAQDEQAVYFEKPKQVIKAKEIKVFQVYPDGSALAMVEDIDNYGTVLALPTAEGCAYYDNQKILIPSNKCIKQIGTYRYTTNQNVEKTVPIVDLFDK